MKALKLKYVVAALILAGAAPAYANLLLVPGIEVTGTGLGAVSTLVTIQDNNLPSKSGKSNGIESGCVTYAGSLGSAYQKITRSSGARYILSPGLTSKAS
jgi:hypothetical protein